MASPMLLTISLLFSLATSLSTSYNRGTYIIHMDKSAIPSPFATPHDWYTSILSSMSSEPLHLYTYKHVINGFSAVLTQAQLDQVELISGHVATFPESYGHRHTTYTPKFLGLNKHTGIWPAGKYGGDDVIIGVLDTGIWPESESFSDHLMPPVPERWRGACENGVGFNVSNCNRKMIGARKFSRGMKQQGLNISTVDDYDSPRDYYGHGTHTSSTAAGSRVLNVDYFGYARGSATGIAPMARLAMYKWTAAGNRVSNVDYYGYAGGSPTGIALIARLAIYKVLFKNGDNISDAKAYAAAATDVLAGMDQAIEDGVDIMSLSLGFSENAFYDNPIAIGAFAALKKGIFVVCGAGNDGPHVYTIVNGAPWVTAVGAGTISRYLGARITLLGGEDSPTLFGDSLYPENLFINRVPLYFASGNRSKETCDIIDLNDFAGKFVFCDNPEAFRPSYENDNNGLGPNAMAGIIVSSDKDEFRDQVGSFGMPYVVVNTKDGDLVKGYILNSKNSNSTLISVEFGLTVFRDKPAPKVAYFSSRGPDEKSPWILKPDILAPGYDILAAWVPNRPFAPIRGGEDYLQTDYAILSGTSMSCPHISGVAALLRSAHKDWTLAAIRSAMMTTAYVTDNIGGTPLDFGAGHVDPNKALDPGLVYDIGTDDYVNYLCAMNYSKSEIGVVIGEGPNSIGCESATLDLNYPSFMVVMNKTNSSSVTFSRVVTNVADGSGSTVYRAVVETQSGMTAVVEPSVIRFEGRYSTAAFNLTVDVVLDGSYKSGYIGNYGFLSWVELNGKHVVRSPIVSAIASPRT